MNHRCLFVAALAAAGCTTQLAGLHDAPVPVPALPEASGPPVSLLVCRFGDLRGERYHKTAAVGLIPGPNFFYAGTTHYYVDRSGLVDDRGGRPQIRVGDLSTALPDMIADSLKKARPTWHVEVTASRDRCRSGGDAAFVIDGEIRRTELRAHNNLVPLGLLSLLGTPFTFLEFTGDVAVEVRRADTGAAVWRHDFQVDERRAVGLYYNKNAGLALFERLLRETVERSAAGAVHVAERGAAGDGGTRVAAAP